MAQRILIVNAFRRVRVEWNHFSRERQSIRMGGSERSVTVCLRYPAIDHVNHCAAETPTAGIQA